MEIVFIIIGLGIALCAIGKAWDAISDKKEPRL
jgi:hypothetical protein